jgi:hypothetical protein
MAGMSVLDPDNLPEPPDRVLGRGHGTGALGPSDSSDSGSDIAGGNVGPDVGDTDLDSDSDAEGTGERAAAGRDTHARDGVDIDVDHIETISEEVLDEDDLEFLSSRPPGQVPRRPH